MNNTKETVSLILFLSGSSGYTAEEDAQARAEGYADARDKRMFEEYNEKYGTNLQPVTQEDLDRWGIVIDW